MASVLIIEDDSTFAQIIEGFLTKNNFEVTTVSNVAKALKLIAHEDFQLLLIDYRLPDGTGIDVLNHRRETGLTVPAIIMTSFNDVRTAVKAIQLGAADYITKPINPDELLMIISNALQKKEKPKTTSSDNFIRGKSEVANRLYQHIDLVASTDMSVIIQGESGTGKEFAARTLHLQSKRKNKPFIAIDCGALSKDLAASELFGHVKGAFTGAVADKKGSFEAANGGTIFLDEIGNLSYEVQVKLLRALQERVIQPLGSNKQIAVDVRVITATNDDLANSMKNGEFREDLYHRLNEFKIQLPPLRERGIDLELFIDLFVKLSNQELDRNVKEIDKDTRSLLLKYDWPGNLRELKNVIKRMVLLTSSTVATADSLPDEMKIAVATEVPLDNPSDLKAVNESNERALITETLAKVKYNKSKAAKLLNIDRKTLYAKMERYGID
ncbi:sigma-54-dependent transcriptional regulator [Pedobacter chitinilyticus]|uniref:Sigma-54-dependent Fis family transcriptional regulator n=1 Tax=Pedobacter chitinilyticus TaxID=2233776 RepID=A0A3S3PY22_9SPHI|nr:sigma-54 dependent transcriptional regulator [Pedobacter chitinilyticus]RWU05487.1 sigma-54-dependent Fis family transcriptional regulator [Pedobacter chitinilyticus]